MPPKPSYRGRATRYTKRHFIRLLSLCSIVGLCFLVAIRWRAWFSNKPEEAYHTAEVIDRITLTPGADFMTERSISWRCGEHLLPSWIEYSKIEKDSILLDPMRIEAEGQSIQTRAGQGCFYSVHLQDLEAGERYYYRVHTGVHSSPIHSFTLPQSKERSDFLYIGDVQDPDGILSDSLLPRLQGVLPRLDFLAAAGDQIEGPANQYWDIWYKSLGSWSPELCIVAATGNHEYLKKGLLRELDPRWIAQYIYPQHGPKGFEGRTYYIDFPLMRFIVLDSNGITTPLDILRHRSWLKQTLENSRQAWQVVMFHHAIYSVREGRMNAIMRYGFKDILQEGGADLVLQGHDHAYSRITSRNEQGDTIPPMYIISSSSPKTYRNGFDKIHDRLGSGLQLYQHISLTAQSLRYRSYQYDGNLYDDVELLQDSLKPQAIHIKDYARHIPEQFRFDSFGSNNKGEKKARKYQQDIQDYLRRKGQP